MNAEPGRLPADAGTGPLGLRPEPVPVSAIRQVSTVADDGDWHTDYAIFCADQNRLRMTQGEL